MGGKQIIILSIIMFSFISSAFGIRVNYITHKDNSDFDIIDKYYDIDEYGYVKYNDEDVEYYKGFQLEKEPKTYYYCETNNGDKIDAWLECINPYYTKGIRLSNTLHRQGFNWNVGSKRNLHYQNVWSVTSKVIYT